MSQEKDAAATARPAKRRLWLKLSLAVVAAIILIIALLPYVLPTGWLTNMVISAAQSNVNAPVSIGSVTWGWFGGVSVNEVVIGQTPGFGTGNLLSAKAVSVRVSLLDLLAKKITVKSVTVDTPQVALVRDEQGAWNYQTLVKASEKPAQPAQPSQPSKPASLDNFSLGVLRLTNGTVAFDDRKENLKLTATNVNASVDADWSGRDITGGAKASFDLEQPSGKGRFEFAAANIDIPKQPTGDAMQKAAASGTITVTGINLGEAIGAVAPAYKDYVSGKLTLQLDYQVKGGAVSVKADRGSFAGLVLGKAVMASGPVSIGDVGFTIDATAAQGADGASVDLRKLGLTAAFANLTASGKMTAAGKEQAVSARVVGTLTPGAIPAGLVALPADFKSTGAVKIDASMEGGPAPGKFSLVLDGQDLGITFGSSLRKQQGKAALVSLSGNMHDKQVTVDNVEVTLAGGKVKASGSVDQATGGASWNLAVNLDNLNVNDYYPGSGALIVSGAVTSAGSYAAATQGKAAVLDAGAKFDKLTVTATAAKGATVAISGSLAGNTQRIQAQDLTINVGSQPVTIQANLDNPLVGPTGSISLRAQEINVDDAMAVAGAFTSTAPGAPAKAGQAQGAPQPAAAPQAAAAPQQTPQQKQARDDFYRKSNVTLNVQVDRLVYQGMPGTNLVVAGKFVNGKGTVRVTANLFGGNMDVTGNCDLLATDGPFDASVSATGAQAGEAAGPYLSKYMPGSTVTGATNVKMTSKGVSGPDRNAMLNSINGDGEIDVSNGTLTIAGLPAQLVTLIGFNLQDMQFQQLQIPVQIRNGVVTYSLKLPTGRNEVFVEGKALLAGGSSEAVGFAPTGSSARIHLLNIENGSVRPVRPDQLIADLAKAGVSGGLQGLLPGGQSQGQQPGQPQTTQQQVIQGIGGLIGGIGGKKHK